MSRIPRRALLVASGATAVGGVAAYVTRGKKKHSTPPAIAVNPFDPGLRARALQDEQQLATKARQAAQQISATRGPDAAAKVLILALMNHHNAHASFLHANADALPRPESLALLLRPPHDQRADPIVSLEPSPVPSPSPSIGPTTTPSPTPTPTVTHASPKPTKSASPSPSPTPRPMHTAEPPLQLSPEVHDLLARLSAAEREALVRRSTDCLHAGAELAKVIASIAAAHSVAIDLLTSVPAESAA